jgi:outer membrane receptor protein involved in Fe transport
MSTYEPKTLRRRVRSALAATACAAMLTRSANADEPARSEAADPMAPSIVEASSAHTHESPADHEHEADLEVTVRDDRVPRAASAMSLSGGELRLRPRLRPADLLQAAPGLVTVQHAGGGKANQYFLRGFDIDHGTDLALSVDGVPVNLPSHGHGQGYADLHFVIPELVSSVEIRKGTYDARFGDFATAGAVDLRIADHFDESRASFTAGPFGVVRGLVIASRELTDDWRFVAAAEAYGQDGPFARPENLQRFNVMAKATHDLSAQSQLSMMWSSYSGRWNASGQIPLGEVDAGRLDRFATLDPYEGGSTQRHAATLAFETRTDTTDVRVSAFATKYDFELFSNFTFFLRDRARGDMIEQRDDRVVGGLDARTSFHDHFGPVRLETTFGLQARFDAIENGLFDAPRRERVQTRVLSEIMQSSVGAFVEERIDLARWLSVTAGARLDRADATVDDRSTPIGDGGSVGATLASPKATLVLSPLRELDLFVDFGRGFHSNDARGATRSIEPATLLVPATGYELGVRARPWSFVTLSAAAFRLDLDSEQVYVGDEGTTEPSGATTRLGLELGARAVYEGWLFADADVTFARARFDDSPELVPLAPTRTVSGGVGVRAPFGTFGSLRARHVGDRPANGDGSLVAEAFTVVDLEAGHRLGPVELAIDVLNLFDASWREVQFATESRVRRDGTALEQIHFVPGWPLTILGRLTGYLPER